MKKYVWCVFLLGYSCSSNEIIEKITKLEIEDAHSYKYDLDKCIYTVFYMDKQPLEIPFSLTAVEKEQILRAYNELKISELNEKNAITNNILIEDNCMTMPKLFTTLNISANGISRQIQIDEECKSYSFNNLWKAKRVKEFLSVIWKILKSKSEIKNAPKSDVIYM